jgi:hypothetical protein
MRLQWIVTLAVPTLMACASSSEPEGLPLTGTRESAVLVDDVNGPGWPADLITLDSAAITGDGRLRLFTRYGGGCADHHAALLVGRAFAESQPPMLRARVAHEANNDPCKALIARTLEFNLKPVRDHFQNAYNSGTGSVVIDLGGLRVTYVFQ